MVARPFFRSLPHSLRSTVWMTLQKKYTNWKRNISPRQCLKYLPKKNNLKI